MCAPMRTATTTTTTRPSRRAECVVCSPSASRAISLHRVAFGLVLIVAFSVGLALAITAVGLAAVLAKKAFARRSFDGLLLRALPALSAAVILAAGIAMTVRALPGVS